MRHCIAICFVTLLAFLVSAAEPRPSNAVVPQSGQTREHILAAIEKIKGYGIIEWTETSHWGRRIFVVWYCPFSGRAAVYAHAYYFDDKEWHLFWDRLLDGTHKLSVELPADKDVLRCRGADGSVVHTEPLDNVPKFYDKKHLEQK
ncbi:MAG: hypothetical protein QOF48_230 [Verrucomicrobiota bacterium]|jgi:hypothetical protein